jgi:hypothetical protein
MHGLLHGRHRNSHPMIANGRNYGQHGVHDKPVSIRFAATGAVVAVDVFTFRAWTLRHCMTACGTPLAARFTRTSTRASHMNGFY